MITVAVIADSLEDSQEMFLVGNRENLEERKKRFVKRKRSNKEKRK